MNILFCVFDSICRMKVLADFHARTKSSRYSLSLHQLHSLFLTKRVKIVIYCKRYWKNLKMLLLFQPFNSYHLLPGNSFIRFNDSNPQNHNEQTTAKPQTKSSPLHRKKKHKSPSTHTMTRFCLSRAASSGRAGWLADDATGGNKFFIIGLSWCIYIRESACACARDRERTTGPMMMM